MDKLAGGEMVEPWQDSSKLNGDGLAPNRPDFVSIPNRGDRVELLQPHLGVRMRGRVFYADQLQILVKWDDGRSESLRAGTRVFRILREAPGAPLEN
jgi:hypothetical protein